MWSVGQQLWSCRSSESVLGASSDLCKCLSHSPLQYCETADTFSSFYYKMKAANSSIFLTFPLIFFLFLYHITAEYSQLCVHYGLPAGSWLLTFWWAVTINKVFDINIVETNNHNTCKYKFFKIQNCKMPTNTHLSLTMIGFSLLQNAKG